MSLKSKLSEELKQALRAKDQAKLRTLRALISALQLKEIEDRQGGEAVLTEQQEWAVLQKQAKQRNDSIAQFRAAGREDLAHTEEEELQIIQSYLPEELSDEEILVVVRQTIEETGVTSAKEMGKLMGAVMGKLKGKADGKRIQSAVKSLLS
ncbi:MAG TPA: GatB/YqeY domain-containing protein [Rhodothermales bacterium]|nr:GatB/YqeY domain-containing protein [Rhodothermales bacterium]HRR07061.1 GatB/YqeY domain-containing protein [Rhodothermales bacterium]